MPGLAQKIAIVNQKGGAGKSTTTVLLAKAFNATGHSVLVVDCDAQGGATTLFGGKADKGLYDAITGGSLSDCIHTLSAGLSILSGDYRLNFEFTTFDEESLVGIAKDVDADYVIFDTAPSISGLTIAAIHVADRVLIPSEVSETAFRPTIYTVDRVREMGKKPEVLLSGWKNPELLTGTKKLLAKEYFDAFHSYLVGTLPRTLSAAQAATTRGKWTTKLRQTIEQPLLDLFGGAE